MSNKAYAFDIDDNLLHTEVTVFLEKKTRFGRKKIEIPEKELRNKLCDSAYRFPNNDAEQCFHHMRTEGTLKKHLFAALEDRKFGPSREKFKIANQEASPIGLITARGHPVRDLKEAHHAMLLEAFSSEDQERFLENMNKRLQLCEKNKEKMLKLFLDMNYYAPCSLPSYLKKIGLALSSDIPERKSIAFKDFIKHITRLNSSKLTNPEKKQLKIGFSDDSLSNLDAVESTIQNELIHDYPDIIFSVYNTNIPHIIKKISYANQKITLKK